MYMYMRGITSMDQADLYFSWRIREMLSVKQVPQGELRRLGLMTTLLEMKSDKHREVRAGQQDYLRDDRQPLQHLAEYPLFSIG